MSKNYKNSIATRLVMGMLIYLIFLSSCISQPMTVAESQETLNEIGVEIEQEMLMSGEKMSGQRGKETPPTSAFKFKSKKGGVIYIFYFPYGE